MASNPIARDNLYLLTKKLGLSAFESKAYICFLTIGNGLSAKDISKSTGIPLTRVYDVMKALEEKCLVTKNKLSKPVKYYLNDPAYSLMLLLNKKKMQINEEIAMLESWVEEMKRITIKDADNAVNIYPEWALYDSEQDVYESLIPALIKDANSEVIIVGRNIINTINERFVDEAIKGVERGVAFKTMLTLDSLDSLLTFNGEEAIEKKAMLLKLFQVYNMYSDLVSVRASDLINVVPFGIFDREKVGFSVQSPKNSKYIVTLVTDKKAIVDEFYEIFEDLWSKALDIDLNRFADSDMHMP
ncbi:MAG: helix-turn-helix domain-containing protein [Candidatus Nitrosocaldus sp.]